MTKKNSTPKSNATVTDDNRQHHNQNPQETNQKAMEEQHDASEVKKLQNLKSLNEFLLKQTVDKRMQYDSLAKEKDELENELARHDAERTELRDQLEQVSDKNIESEITLDLVTDIVGNEFKEFGVGVERLIKENDDKESKIRVLKREADEVLSKVEIEKEQLKKVCDERDSIKTGFELQREEANRLKEKVVRLEENELSLDKVIAELRSEYNSLVIDMRMSEELIERVKKEKIALEKTIEGKTKEVDGLKNGIQALVSVKSEMEIAKIDELQKELDKLNETVQRLTKEEKVSRDAVIELGKSLEMSMENERAMLEQVAALGNDKRMKEFEVQRLIREKNSAEKQMERINVESSDKEKLIEKLSQEKIELEGRILNQEAKLVELNQMANVVASLQKECDDRTETNDKLTCKLGQVHVDLSEAQTNSVNALEKLAEEKKRGEDLKAVVLNSETAIQRTVEVLKKTMMERESLFTAKKDLENRLEVSEKEKDVLEKELVDTKKVMDALKTKLESTEKQSLIIKEIKKEAETMRESKEEAQKKKKFWTIVSSVTSVFAAASFAYAARTRQLHRNGFSL